MLSQIRDLPVEPGDPTVALVNTFKLSVGRKITISLLQHVRQEGNRQKAENVVKVPK